MGNYDIVLDVNYAVPERNKEIKSKYMTLDDPDSADDNDYAKNKVRKITLDSISSNRGKKML